jgi:biotin synthase-like enzyme
MLFSLLFRFKDNLQKTLDSWWFNSFVLLAAAAEVALYFKLHAQGDTSLIDLTNPLRASQVCCSYLCVFCSVKQTKKTKNSQHSLVISDLVRINTCTLGHPDAVVAVSTLYSK